jgi:anti-sigma factor RsiW
VSSLIEHCAECVKLLGDYVDGTLPKEDADALEQHLSLCMPCITFLRTYKATGRLCRKKLAREMPDELRHGLSTFLASHVPGFQGGPAAPPAANGGASAPPAANAAALAGPVAPKKVD